VNLVSARSLPAQKLAQPVDPIPFEDGSGDPILGLDEQSSTVPGKQLALLLSYL
jgi:hypothetical protein